MHNLTSLKLKSHGRRTYTRLRGRTHPLPRILEYSENVTSEADVVVLVAMPGTPLVPYVPHKTGHEAVGLHSSPKEDHLWSNYVVGVTQIPFPWSG